MAKILIVDDRPTNRELLVTLLGYTKHQVLEAIDGEEGLAVAQAHHPDLIITDIVMPKIDGYEFARQVRADPSIKDTQIIFYTSSYIISETLRLANACGVSTVIGKPIEPELLLKKIEEALTTTQPLPNEAPASEEFHREHMRILTDTLVNKVEQLENEILERKQVESILQASELRFRSLIEHGLDSISLLTANGQLIWESPSAHHILGYGFNEYLGRNLFDLIHPDDIERITNAFQELLKEPKTVISQSFRLRHASGKWIWVESISTNLLDEPSVGAIVINYRDVTERKRADDELKKNEQVLRLFVENSPAAIAMLDRDMKYIVASQRYIEDYKIKEKNIVGRSHYEILPEIPERWKEIHKRCLEGATEKSDQDPFPREDGHIDWVRWEIHPWYELNGSIGGIIIFSEVITERKKIEQALRDSEGQYRKLFEDSPISLWIEDFTKVKIKLDQLREQGVQDISAYIKDNPEFVMDCARSVEILDVNTAALNLYHAIRKEDLMSTLANVYLMMSSFEQFEYELNQMANGKLSFEREGTDRTLTGEEIHVSIYWSVVPGYENNLARVIVSTIDLTERKRAEERIQRQLQRLRALRAIDLAISNTFDMNLSLKIVINGAISQLGVSAAAVLLFNPTMSTLEYVAGEGFNLSTIENTRMRLGEGLAGRAALERTTIQVNNLEQVGKEFVKKQLFREEGFVSYFAIPLIAKGELKGVLEVFTRTELYPDHEWITFLETLSGQAALAIHVSQLFNGLQRSNIDLRLAYDATIEGWSAALDLRDKETEGHSQRVTDMTLELARRMNITESGLTQVRRGALLHDIGKLGVPDHILLKPEKLTDAEWKIMQKHPTYAYDMLSAISYLKPALDIPYCHHEKWDGTGYPRGLKHEEIPIAARIFSIVDVWDALTSDRPYRSAWTRERSFEYIREQSGKHFDPQVVQIFLKMLNNE